MTVTLIWNVARHLVLGVVVVLVSPMASQEGAGFDPQLLQFVLAGVNSVHLRVSSSAGPPSCQLSLPTQAVKWPVGFSIYATCDINNQVKMVVSDAILKR